jgi:hypothetical protein
MHEECSPAFVAVAEGDLWTGMQTFTLSSPSTQKYPEIICGVGDLAKHECTISTIQANAVSDIIRSA